MKVLTEVKNLLTAVVAVAGLVAFATPSVEITRVNLADARDGRVDYTYKVSNLVGGDYNLLIKVSAANGTKSVVLTNESVTAGTVNASVNVKALFGKAYPNVALFAELKPGGVQLWAGGPYWASRNIGATKPEEYGYYFWWGDTVGYTQNVSKTSWVSSQDGKTTTGFDPWDPIASATLNKSFEELWENGWIDKKGNLLPSHDAATVQWGGPWRMPTKAEMEKLLEECDITWKKHCAVITGKGDYKDRSILLPTGGEVLSGGKIYDVDYNGSYWISTFDGVQDYYAEFFQFKDRTGGFLCDNIASSSGISVRPVHDAK